MRFLDGNISGYFRKGFGFVVMEEWLLCVVLVWVEKVRRWYWEEVDVWVVGIWNANRCGDGMVRQPEYIYICSPPVLKVT